MQARVAPSRKIRLFAMAALVSARARAANGDPGEAQFIDSGHSAHCEVASPFYTRFNQPAEIARKPAVGRLGYDLDDSKGNYVREFALDAENAPPLADFMLRSLYEAFLNSGATILEFESPMVKSSPPAKACAPTS